MTPELVVHGPDLADALDRPPWTDDAALDVVTTADRLALVRAATGRGTRLAPVDGHREVPSVRRREHDLASEA